MTDSIFNFDEQSFDKGRQGVGWAFLPLKLRIQRTLADISRAMCSSLKTTLTGKETLSQDQGMESQMSGVRNRKIRKMCPLAKLSIFVRQVRRQSLQTKRSNCIHHQSQKIIHTLTYKPQNKTVFKNF